MQNRLSIAHYDLFFYFSSAISPINFSKWHFFRWSISIKSARDNNNKKTFNVTFTQILFDFIPFYWFDVVAFFLLSKLESDLFAVHRYSRVSIFFFRLQFFKLNAFIYMCFSIWRLFDDHNDNDLKGDNDADQHSSYNVWMRNNGFFSLEKEHQNEMPNMVKNSSNPTDWRMIDVDSHCDDDDVKFKLIRLTCLQSVFLYSDRRTTTKKWKKKTKRRHKIMTIFPNMFRFDKTIHSYNQQS